MSTSLRAVGRSACSGCWDAQEASTKLRAIALALRSSFPEYWLPKLSRRSHGVFVSEMPHETEEEEERDEEDSSDDLDDVENFLNEDDESDLVLEEGEVRELLASAWKQKRQISKEKTASRIWTTVEISSERGNAEVSRRS